MQDNALFSRKVYTAGTNFTRPPVATVMTNLNSGQCQILPCVKLTKQSNSKWSLLNRVLNPLIGQHGLQWTDWWNWLASKWQDLIQEFQSGLICIYLRHVIECLLFHAVVHWSHHADEDVNIMVRLMLRAQYWQKPLQSEVGRGEKCRHQLSSSFSLHRQISFFRIDIQIPFCDMTDCHCLVCAYRPEVSWNIPFNCSSWFSVPNEKNSSTVGELILKQIQQVFCWLRKSSHFEIVCFNCFLGDDIDTCTWILPLPWPQNVKQAIEPISGSFKWKFHEVAALQLFYFLVLRKERACKKKRPILL